MEKIRAFLGNLGEFKSFFCWREARGTFGEQKTATSVSSDVILTRTLFVKKENKAVRPFKSGSWLLVALAPGL